MILSCSWFMQRELRCFSWQGRQARFTPSLGSYSENKPRSLHFSCNYFHLQSFLSSNLTSMSLSLIRTMNIFYKLHLTREQNYEKQLDKTTCDASLGVCFNQTTTQSKKPILYLDHYIQKMSSTAPPSFTKISMSTCINKEALPLFSNLFNVVDSQKDLCW